MNCVIYARFSSHNQTEQSIEGQLKVCYDYAQQNGLTVIGEYIDRAQTGTNDKRIDFQRMIADSKKHTFEAVLVYQLDRFARNRYDSAFNKNILKKNGVKVISARENITDDASGVFLEGVLESMAEYYSVELSQKIRRGHSMNAQKCLFNGSNPGLGFKVAEDKTFYVDENEAAVVREIFRRYAAGETVAEITADLNRRGIKTAVGNDFNKNSLHRMLKNKRYIGVYMYDGTETPGGMPRILEAELFYRVQEILEKNNAAPARARGKEEYLLTTKLFCGHCKTMMTGYGGTGKLGTKYHYYICKKAKDKKCDKKIVSKEAIENKVVALCLGLLNEESIGYIAKELSAVCEKSEESLTIKSLRQAIHAAETAIENLLKCIEAGQATDILLNRLAERTAEKEKLEAELAQEENKSFTLSESEIRCFLQYIKALPDGDVSKRRAIINIFVNTVYLYDDRMTVIFNGADKTVSRKDIPLDDIESAFADFPHGECSSMKTSAPPKTNGNFRKEVVVFSFAKNGSSRFCVGLQ